MPARRTRYEQQPNGDYWQIDEIDRRDSDEWVEVGRFYRGAETTTREGDELVTRDHLGNELGRTPAPADPAELMATIRALRADLADYQALRTLAGGRGAAQAVLDALDADVAVLQAAVMAGLDAWQAAR
jgi:hypothetical protein